MLLHVDDSQHIASVGKTVLRRGAKVLLGSAECVTAGFAVGTAARFLAEGASGYTYNLGNAVYDSGIPFAIVGLLVGPLIYAILRSRATWKQWAVLVGIAFITAASTWACTEYGMSFMVTLVVTIGVALALRFGQVLGDRKVYPPRSWSTTLAIVILIVLLAILLVVLLLPWPRWLR